jgi:hypothetical protein
VAQFTPNACLHAPAPPPAGCFHCQQVSHVPVREKGPGRECRFRASERECRQNRPHFQKKKKTQTFDHKEKKCARGISPLHARMVKFSCFVTFEGRFSPLHGPHQATMPPAPSVCITSLKQTLASKMPQPDSSCGSELLLRIPAAPGLSFPSHFAALPRPRITSARLASGCENACVRLMYCAWGRGSQAYRDADDAGQASVVVVGAR